MWSVSVNEYIVMIHPPANVAEPLAALRPSGPHQSKDAAAQVRELAHCILGRGESSPQKRP